MKQPFASFNFRVEVSDSNGQLALFQEVSGLSVNINTTDFEEGGVNNTTHKIIEHTSYGNVTLKRGLIDGEFFVWINDISKGIMKRRDIIIQLEDDSGEAVIIREIKILLGSARGMPGVGIDLIILAVSEL